MHYIIQIGFDGEIDEDTISVATLNKIDKCIDEIVGFVNATLNEDGTWRLRT